MEIQFETIGNSAFLNKHFKNSLIQFTIKHKLVEKVYECQDQMEKHLSNP